MKTGFLATLLALTATVAFSGERRDRQPQHYRALPKTNTRTPMPVVNTPPSEEEIQRLKARHRQRKQKRGY